ncbi:hypothetical protein ACWEPZ_27095 [Streptomyces sp. NPDC004288]|uniref:hypothetical protein n=1 Tax=unclassified Streptomyces TaxID=2593676 RepID=UPI0033C85AE2
MVIADAASVVADVLVIVLALLLTQAWGRRFPAWPLALPLWARPDCSPRSWPGTPRGSRSPS